MHRKQQAAVSLIELRRSDNFFDTEIIFIKRSMNESDPWSGHCAFPGGGVEASDRDVVYTAIRETQEEIGLLLPKDSYQSKLCKLVPRTIFNNAKLHLTCLIFSSDVDPSFFDYSEVSDVFTVCVREFLDEENYIYCSNKMSLEFIVASKNYKIWGLTLAMIFEYLNRFQPLLVQDLSFYKSYEKHKNNILEISYAENISIEN